MATGEDATSAMVDLSTTGGSAVCFGERPLEGMVSRVLMCPHIVPPALVGCTFDGIHFVLDKGFQLLEIFVYPGQHNLGVNPVIGVGFFHLENGGNLGQQLGQQQTSQEPKSGHGDRLLWSYTGLG